jgi:predicted MFS family arabinose efflux permease
MAGSASIEQTFVHLNASDAPRSGWGAVLALTFCVSTLIASEFMPVSILTPIASDLHLTEGTAGQAISVSGLVR